MHTKRGSSWKLWFIIVALVVVIAVLGFLCVRFFLSGSGFSLFGSSKANVDTSLSTQIAAQDANGKDVTKNVSVTAGTLRPDAVDAAADLTLLEIEWSGKKSADFPMILTVSDLSFPNDDGLAVYHYANGAWELLGTYLIADHSVSFQTDSLSPFAFQVISSQADPTPTPEPTPTAEPTATPEPTPEPIDYGVYDTVQVGEFVQVDSLSVEGAYVIALVNDEAVTQTAEQDNSDVTLFDAVQGGQTLTATILMNYDGEKLAGVEVQVTKGSDGRYTITDTVTEGMLWNAVTAEYYSDADRFSLENNERYLNLNDSASEIILNDNATRTRWLAQTITPDGSTRSFPSLTYRLDSNSYYIKSFETTETADAEGTDTESEFTASVSTDSKNAQQVVIFQLRTAVPTASPSNNSGLTILTGTPSAIAGLDATPPATSTPDDSDVLIPVDPTTPTPPATQHPDPSEDPINTPDTTPDPASGSNATTPQPVPPDDASDSDA